MKKLEELIEKYALILMIPVFAVYVYTRIKHLGEMSYYLHIDELRSAFDSMTMAHHGGKGEFYAPSLFVLVNALFMKVKGGLFSLKAFRLLSVAAGLFGMIFSYLTVHLLTGKKKYAFLEAVIIASLPVYYISQRTGMGAYLFLEIAPAAFYFLIKGIDTGNKKLFAVSGIFWGLILLTHGQAYLIVPVFLAAALIYLIVSKKIDIKDAGLLVIPVAVCALLLLVTGTNNPQLSFANIPQNFMNFKGMFWDDDHPYNISSSFGTIYVFSVPVLIVGAVISIGKMITAFKNKTYDVSVILWMLAVISFLIDLMTKNADISTTNCLFFITTILIMEGLVYISENLNGAYLIELLTYVICFVVFTYFYFINFNSSVNNSTDHEQGIVVDKSVGEAVKESLKTMPDKDICIMSDNFEGKDLMVALYANATREDYEQIKGKEEFSFGNIRAVSDEEIDMSGNTVYLINQAERQEQIDKLTESGWGNVFLKEYVICYMQ